MQLAELTKAYRTKTGLSQRQMSERCGLSSGYISLIEKGINPKTGKPNIPSIAALDKIAKCMEMTIDDLISICDDMPVRIKIEDCTAVNPLHPNTLQETAPSLKLSPDELELIKKYRQLSADGIRHINDQMDFALVKYPKSAAAAEVI